MKAVIYDFVADAVGSVTVRVRRSLDARVISRRRRRQAARTPSICAIAAFMPSSMPAADGEIVPLELRRPLRRAPVGEGPEHEVQLVRRCLFIYNRVVVGSSTVRPPQRLGRLNAELGLEGVGGVRSMPL